MFAESNLDIRALCPSLWIPAPSPGSPQKLDLCQGSNHLCPGIGVGGRRRAAKAGYLQAWLSLDVLIALSLIAFSITLQEASLPHEVMVGRRAERHISFHRR